nr:zonadhesin-like [Onthophagus taurus]
MVKHILGITLTILLSVTSTLQQCATNEYYSLCGTNCREYCHWDPSAISCLYDCNGHCFCNPGYELEAVDSDTCILSTECDNVPTCGPNQQYQVCGSRCPDYCGKDPETSCIQLCTRGCFCKPGYIARTNPLTSTLDCILEDDCVETTTAEARKRKN